MCVGVKQIGILRIYFHQLRKRVDSRVYVGMTVGETVVVLETENDERNDNNFNEMITMEQMRKMFVEPF